MRTSLLLLAAALLPLPLAAQRTCDSHTGQRLPNGQVIYFSCAADRAPRPVELPPWGRALLDRWEHDPSGWATVSIIYYVDTLGHPDGLSAPYLRMTDTLLVGRLFDQVRAWRYSFGLRGRSPVVVADTLVIHPPYPMRWPPPNDCFDCDTVATTTQWRVNSTTIQAVQCDSATAKLARGEVTQWEDWVYTMLPGCPGAARALATNLREHPPIAPGGGLGRYRATLIATLQDPLVTRELMRSARQGRRFAFRFLPIALGLGFERVTDSTAGRWDKARGIPAERCGTLNVYLPNRPGTGRRPDPRAVRHALRLADSVVADPESPDPIRSSAWCLAAQLR